MIFIKSILVTIAVLALWPNSTPPPVPTQANVKKAQTVQAIPKPEAKPIAKVEEVRTEPEQAPVVQEEPKPFKVSGNKEAWLRASGIPEHEWWAVDYIVSRESGWNPCAFYPGQSDCNANPVNACGLVQQNPCHKIPGDWRDPVAALKWQKQYVTSRYGGYIQAVEYWKVNHHY